MREQLNRILETSAELYSRAAAQNANDIDAYRQRAKQISDRVDRAIRKETKYSININRTKSGAKNLQEWGRAATSLHDGVIGDEQRAETAKNKLWNRKYSRNTYMGLNNG